MKLVATVSSNKEIRMAEKADIIEIRLDMLKEKVAMPDKEVIVTCRRKKDGGLFTGRDEERIALMSNYRADYVDLEYDLPDEFFDFPCKVIESYHNFYETPNYRFLKGLVENRRGDFFKIATTGKSRRDVETIVKILIEHDNVIAFLMGKNFAFTRLFSLFLGSPFIYCYVGKSKAPGQIELEKAYEVLRLLGVR
jgi:3-dehydroquinate dehydratase-1